MVLRIRNVEFCIKTEEICIGNGEFCITNEESGIIIDEFCIKIDELHTEYRRMLRAGANAIQGI